MADDNAPALEEACERISAWLATGVHTQGVHTQPEVIAHYDGATLRRSDLVALVAHCGWNVDAEHARVDDSPAPVADVDMFAGGAS